VPFFHRKYPDIPVSAARAIGRLTLRKFRDGRTAKALRVGEFFCIRVRILQYLARKDRVLPIKDDTNRAFLSEDKSGSFQGCGDVMTNEGATSDDSASTALGPVSRSSDRLQRLVPLAAALACNALEWYDYATFGLLASYMARALFPTSSSGGALLATFALFGVGFILRPLGGIVLGRIGDRAGRKPALLITITLMSLGMLMIACVPTYRSAGLLAPAWLLTARLIQGLSAGGELGIASAYLAEWAPEGRRGVFTSFLSVTLALGSMVASGVAGLLISSLSAADMTNWGWRVPFALGAALGLIGLWVRSKAEETPVFQAHRVRFPASPVSLRRYWLKGLFVFALSIHWTVCHYIFLIYMPTFARIHGHLSAAQALNSNTLCLAAVACLVPICGWASDRFGRRPQMLASCVIVILGTFPAFQLIATAHSFVLTVLVQFVFACAIALYSGSATILIAEIFPTHGRSRWSAVPYAMAAAIFGGFAPFAADLLIRITGSALAPSLYVTAASAVSFVAIFLSRETARLELGFVAEG
jgi:MHS family proline/betaine transporter-like MFS transporter